MKYETIDAKQIDDLMDRVAVREPADWQDKSSNDDNSSKPSKPSTPTSTPPIGDAGEQAQ